MKDRFIVIQQWMITELGLKGSELIAYALIYGLTIHESDFHGTAEYLSTWLGITPKKCYRVLASLCERGLLAKTEFYRVNHYVAIFDGSKTEPQGSKTEPQGSKTEPRNNDIYRDNITDSYKENTADGGLFPDTENNNDFVPVIITRPRRTSEPLCLFEDSRYFDVDKFVAEFKAPEYKDIDIAYYYGVCSDWSSSNGAKKRDWIATARNIMRSDKEKGKLHLLGANNTGLDADTIEYLKQMAD